MKAHKQKIDSVYFSLFFEVDNVISVSIITMSCYFSRIIISVSVGCSLLMNSSLKASNEMNCGFFFISSVRQVTDCGAPWQAGCRNLQSLPLAWHCQIDHSACGSQSVSPASCRAVSRLAVTAVLSGCSLGDHRLTISESAAGHRHWPAHHSQTEITARPALLSRASPASGWSWHWGMRHTCSTHTELSSLAAV